MRCSIESRDRIYVKGYGFLSFAKNMCKSLSSNSGRNLVDSTKMSARDVLKTALKRKIQKMVEATGYLVGNKIAENIAKAASKTSCEDLSKMLAQIDEILTQPTGIPKENFDYYNYEYI